MNASETTGQDEAVEMAECSHCGRPIDYQDTIDGECPECNEAACDLDGAEGRAEYEATEVERLMAELAEARADLRAANKAAREARARREKRAAY